MTHPEAPDDQELQQYLSGTLSPDRAENIERLADQQPDLLLRIKALSGDDPHQELAEHLRESATAAPLLATLKEPLAGPDGSDPAIESVLRRLGPRLDPCDIGSLGRYRIQDLIARGGMGIILKGYDPAEKIEVALKVLSPHLEYSPTALLRFRREVEVMKRLENRYILTILEAKLDGPLPHFVMPYIDGGSLDQYLMQNEPLPDQVVARLGAGLANGLASAHAEGIIHRDIKPGNVLLCKNLDFALLSDFGLARGEDQGKLTQDDLLNGTWGYTAPELLDAVPPSPASDVFSLGAVLYSMINKEPAFEARTTAATVKRIALNTPKPLSEECGALGMFIHKMLHDDPEQRPTAHETVEHLNDFADSPDSIRARPTRPWRWKTWLGAVALALSIALIAGLVLRSVTSPAPSPTASLLSTEPLEQRSASLEERLQLCGQNAHLILDRDESISSTIALTNRSITLSARPGTQPTLNILQKDQPAFELVDSLLVLESISIYQATSKRPMIRASHSSRLHMRCSRLERPDAVRHDTSDAYPALIDLKNSQAQLEGCKLFGLHSVGLRISATHQKKTEVDINDSILVTQKGVQCSGAGLVKWTMDNCHCATRSLLELKPEPAGPLPSSEIRWQNSQLECFQKRLISYPAALASKVASKVQILEQGNAFFQQLDPRLDSHSNWVQLSPNPESWPETWSSTDRKLPASPALKQRPLWTQRPETLNDQAFQTTACAP